MNVLPPQERATARLIQVGGKSFVTDLLWDPLSSATSAKKSVMKFARENDYNLAAIYSGPGGLEAAYGYVMPTRLKSYVGAYPLAAVLAREIAEKSWIGVFDLGDGNHALVAVADGQVVPGCDAVGSYEATSTLLEEMWSYTDWERVYLGDDSLAALVGCDDVSRDTSPLDALLAPGAKKRDSRLRMWSTVGGINPKTLALFAGALFLLAAGLGYHLYAEYRQEQEAKIQAERLRSDRAKQAKRDREKALAVVEERRLKPSWPTQPSGVVMLDACQEAFQRFPLVVAGWRLQAINCSGRQVEGQYVRPNGAIMQEFSNAAQAAIGRGAFVNTTVGPDKSSLWLNLPSLPARGEEDLPGFKPWSMKWVSYFQGLPLTAKPTLAAKPHPEPIKPERTLLNILGKEEAVPPPPWWDTYGWTLTVERMPIFTILRPLMGPGLVVRTVRVTTGTKGSWTWFAEGEMNVMGKEKDKE